MSLTNTEIEALNNVVIGAWNFDEGSGTTAFDSKGSNDGNISNATWTTGKIGDALDFNNVGNVKLTNDINNSTGSINIWIKVHNIGIDNTMFNKYSTSPNVNDNSHLFFIGASNNPYFIFRDGTGTAGVNYYSIRHTSTITTGEWYMVTLTADGIANKLYLNGVEGTILDFGVNAGKFLQGFTPTEIGFGERFRYNNYFDGIIDMPTIFNKALSQEEINYLYNSGAGRQYPYPYKTRGNVFMLGGFKDTTVQDLNNAVISAWNFDEGSGTTAFDEKGSNDGSISGATWVTGKIGNALSFDGSNDNVTVSGFNISGLSSWTYSGWIKTPGNGSDYNVLMMDGSTSNASNLFIVYIKDGLTNTELRIFNNGSGIYTYGTSSGFPNDIWTYLTLTYNGTTFMYYKNGSLVNSQNISVSYSGVNNLYIGGGYGGTQWYNGEQDAVQIFNKVLSQEEITYLYNSGNGRQYPYN